MCILKQKSILEGLRLFIVHKTYVIVYMVYLISIIMVVFDIESFKVLITVHTRDEIRYICDDSHDDVAEKKGGLCCVAELSGVAY